MRALRTVTLLIALTGASTAYAEEAKKPTPMAAGDVEKLLVFYNELVDHAVKHAADCAGLATALDGVAPGVYEVTGGGLLRVRDGDPAEAIHAAALSQEVSRRAAAVLVFSVDAAVMSWPDASRGYRYGWLDAGIAGGRAYLQGVALGIGVSSIGAFFDDDVAELLRLDPARDLPALLVAIGPKP